MSNLLKKVTSVVAAGAVAMTAVGSTTGVHAASYTYLEAANKLANQAVIVDQSSNPSAYRLADTISRQEALKVMMKLSGLTVNTGACDSPYGDIADTDWACKYAVAALDAGFIAANTNFRPQDEVSKIEGLKMVMQARGIEREANADWRMGYVNTAVAEGIADPFSDYNTSVERGLMFVWAAEAITTEADEEEEISLEDLLGLGDLTDDEEEASNSDDEEEASNSDDDEEEVVVSGDDALTVSLNPETPSDGLAQANTSRIPLLVFDVKAGSEDVTLNEATFEFIGLGDYARLDDVSIYNQIGEKVSKTKSFTEIEREISFDNDIVVEAGKTMTLTVAGQITQDGDDNATYGVKLVDIEASSDVEGEDLVGALLVPAVFSNVAALKIDANKSSGKITVGDTETLAEFDIEETKDNEDVVIKTITLHLPSTSTVDEDDVSNLILYADGVEVANNLMVNSDEEIVAVVDYELAADDTVTFELKGTITGSVGDDFDIAFDSSDDIYAVGATSGMPVALSTALTDAAEELSDAREIEGSEINASFDQSDIDEARPDAEGVHVGDVKLLTLTDNYEVKEIQVTVTASNNTTGKNLGQILSEVELGGSSSDSDTASASTTSAVYTFEDIELSANSEEVLPLTFDIEDDNAFNGIELTFDVSIIEVEDDEENETYNASSNPTLGTILSNSNFDDKDITIETGKFTLADVSVTNRQLVLGDGVETVLYKGKVSIGDADSITLDDLVLVTSSGHTLSQDLDEVMESATLNIGGQTFDADIDNNSVDFTGMNAEIAAGSDNIELLITAELKDNDSVSNGEVIKMEVAQAEVKVEDSDGDDLPSISPYGATTANNSVVLTGVNTKLTQTTLEGQGIFTFAITKNGDNKDDVENVILAGSNSVALAEFTMEADLEDMDVESLKIMLASTGNVSAQPAVTGTTITVTPATTNANVVASSGTTAVAQQTELEHTGAPVELDNAGELSINVDGTVYKDATYAGLATKIAAASNVASATLSGDIITVVAQNAGTPVAITDFHFNGTSDNQLTITTTVLNQTANGATTAEAEVKTYTLSRAMQTGTTNGDTITYNAGTAQTTIAALAADIAADATVASATVSGNTITATAATAGTPMAAAAFVNVPFQNAATTSSTTATDLSDTLTNIRLMDGSTVVADGGVASYNSSTNQTEILFEDFTVVDGQDEIEGTLVADVRTFTTDGDETSAVLGTVVAQSFIGGTSGNAVVEGAQSDNTIAATAGTGNQNGESVSIVPVIITVSAPQSFALNENEATLSFNIDSGNNTLDNDDVKITAIKLATGNAAINLVEDDGDQTVGTAIAANGAITGLANNDIVSGDIWTLTYDNTVDSNGNLTNTDKVKLDTNGITFTVGGTATYTSNNDDQISLGTYTK